MFFLFPCAGVGLIVDFHKSTQGELRVPLGGAETTVPQQFLDGTQIGAGFKQVGGETVAQGMRGDGCG
jgi:hypothetical protein